MLMNPGCRVVRAGGSEDVFTPCYDVPLERTTKYGGDTRAWLLGVRQLALWHEVCAERRERWAAEAARRDAAATLAWARARAERMAREDSAFAVRLMLARADLEASRSAASRAKEER